MVRTMVKRRHRRAPPGSDYLTTGQVAAICKTSTGQIRYHIRTGRLEAECIPALVERDKPIYRIYPDAFREYLRAYWPRVAWTPEAVMKGWP